MNYIHDLEGIYSELKQGDESDIFDTILVQKVFGGWIYYRDRDITAKNKDKILFSTSTAVFVPDKNHEWE